MTSVHQQCLPPAETRPSSIAEAHEVGKSEVQILSLTAIGIPWRGPDVVLSSLPKKNLTNGEVKRFPGQLLQLFRATNALTPPSPASLLSILLKHSEVLRCRFMINGLARFETRGRSIRVELMNLFKFRATQPSIMTSRLKRKLDNIGVDVSNPKLTESFCLVSFPRRYRVVFSAQ